MARGGVAKIGAPREVELIILCARTHIDRETTIRIETLVEEGIDWDHLLEMAQEHRMTPLLFWNLNATCPEAVPKITLDKLRKRFRKNARRNVFLVGEVLRLLNLFEAYGIPAVPFKGPSLAQAVYGNLALRSFVDLDILMHERHVLKAKELLLSQGYQPEYKLTHRQEMALLQSGWALPFSHRGNRIMVDLHWKIREQHFSFHLDSERVWKRLEPSSLAGKQVLTLSSEDLLLILCVHGTSHLWQELELICAVAELIRVNESLDWIQIMEQARELGSERMLFLGLFLASHILGAPLPDEILERARADPAVKVLADQVSQQLFRRPSKPPTIFESVLFHVRARERLRDRVRYSIHYAINPTVGDRALPLPASLSFLYYILRPIRLTGKYGLGLLRRVL